jgi:hypothetical protein
MPVPVLVQVFAAAGGRCECTQTGCHGNAGRCGHERPGHRLVAAPRDGSVPEQAAWRVQVEDLAAWCGPCLDVAGRRGRAERAAVQPVTEELFAIEIEGAA